MSDFDADRGEPRTVYGSFLEGLEENKRRCWCSPRPRRRPSSGPQSPSPTDKAEGRADREDSDEDSVDDKADDSERDANGGLAWFAAAPQTADWKLPDRSRDTGRETERIFRELQGGWRRIYRRARGEGGEKSGEGGGLSTDTG